MNIYENITHYPANYIANPGCYSWCRNMLGKAPRLESRLQLQGLAFRWVPASQRRCRLAAQWVLSQILQPPEGSRVTRAPTFALAKRECALLFSVSSRNNQAHTCTTIGCSILETKEPEEYRTASRMMPVHKYTETLNLHHAVVCRDCQRRVSHGWTHPTDAARRRGPPEPPVDRGSATKLFSAEVPSPRELPKDYWKQRSPKLMPCCWRKSTS